MSICMVVCAVLLILHHHHRASCESRNKPEENWMGEMLGFISQETSHRTDLCSPKVALHCHALPGRLWRVISCRNLAKTWGWCAHFSWADKDSCCDLACARYQEKGHEHCFVIPIRFLLIRGGILGRHKGSALSKPRLAEGRRHGCDAKWQIGLHTSGAP